MMKWLDRRRARQEAELREKVLTNLWRRIIVGNGVFPLEEHRTSWCYITINGENTLNICAAVRLRKSEEEALFGELQVPDSAYLKALKK